MKYMHHVFEVLQTEEHYVKTLHFMYLVWYRPLADGTYGAPKLSRQELDSLFSTLFAPVEDGQALRHSGRNVGVGSTLSNKLSTFEADRTPGAERGQRNQTLGTGLLMRNFTLTADSLANAIKHRVNRQQRQLTTVRSGL